MRLARLKGLMGMLSLCLGWLEKKVANWCDVCASSGYAMRRKRLGLGLMPKRTSVTLGLCTFCVWFFSSGDGLSMDPLPNRYRPERKAMAVRDLTIG